MKYNLARYLDLLNAIDLINEIYYYSEDDELDCRLNRIEKRIIDYFIKNGVHWTRDLPKELEQFGLKINE